MRAEQARLRRGQGQAAQLDLGGEEEGAFRSGQQGAVVEGLARVAAEDGAVGQQVEGVAGVAPGDARAREPARDAFAVFRIAEDVADVAVDARLEGVLRPGALGLEFLRRERTEHGFRPVAEEAPHLQHVIAGAAVLDRVRAAGVIAEHPAHHGPVLRRGLGTKLQAVRLERQIQLVADDTRLHPHPALAGVDLENLREVAREIDHDPGAHHLPGQRGAGSAGDQAQLVGPGIRDQLAQVFVVRRDRHRVGHLLIGRGVGGVEPAQGFAGVVVALEFEHGGEGREKRL